MNTTISRRNFLKTAWLSAGLVPIVKGTALASPSSGDYHFISSLDENPDFDGDRVVTFQDFVTFAREFGGTEPRFDLDSNGVVGFSDFLKFAQAYSKTVNSYPQISPFSQLNLEQVASFTTPTSLNLAGHTSDILEDDLINSLVENEDLVTTFSEDTLTVRPKGTFSGDTSLKFQVNKKTPYTLEDAVEANIPIHVQRDSEAMTLYEESQSKDGAGQNIYLRRFEPFKEIYVYTGNSAQLIDHSNNPKDFTGPKFTQQQLDTIEDALKKRHQLTGGFFPAEPDIQFGTDASKIYHPKKAPAVFTPDEDMFVIYPDKRINEGSTATYREGDKIIKVGIRINPSTPNRTIYHEILDHSVGLDHPTSFTGAQVIFAQHSLGDTTNYTPYVLRPKEIFVGTALYDLNN